MKMSIRLFSLAILAVMCSCNSSTHFLTDSAYRKQVEKDYATKQQQLPGGNLFSVSKQASPTAYEREELHFLYAYMPMGDIANYSADFFLQNIRWSEQARKEMPWGKTLSDQVYRHFVLPVRVNNENLDNSRGVFFNELKDRVKGLSMKDAILEVNHWCHEKVVYRPSDARTSAPLASVKTAYGRCGEESTFTVAALRSVGIPARQVYTPRWAHTDDNHAWVEAYADGKWYFFGACEPEPVLNLGWFNAPASRGMLMHTKVFGRYDGPEEIMRTTPNYTEINVISNYAPYTKADVQVTDASGLPVDSARVEFKLYNYGEFYTVAVKYTDANGHASLSAGKGDMLVWASKGEHFNYGKLSFGKQDKLALSLTRQPGEAYSFDMDLVPPPERANLPEVTKEQRARNDKRMAYEDSVRNAYVATMLTGQQADAFAASLGLDSAVVAPLLVASRGNHEVLSRFLSKAVKDGKGDLAVRLLKVISPKDLRDITEDVLFDNLYYSPRVEQTSYNKTSDGYQMQKAGDYDQHVLSPRVDSEMLTPYKAFFQKAFSENEVNSFRADPNKLVAWCKNNITINNSINSQYITMSPEGVWKARVADKYSLEVFFVSVARSLGIFAWFDQVTGKTQYSLNGQVYDVDFEAVTATQAPVGYVKSDYTPIRSLDNPKYYSHFTLAKYDNGTFHTLNYDEEGEMTWKSMLQHGTKLDAGYYMMVTGTRLASGAVLSHVSFFNVNKDDTTHTHLVMRESKDQVQVIGNFDSESTCCSVNSDTRNSILQTCGRGYFVVGILGVGQEPTNHALRDIAAMRADFEKWGRKMVLLFPDEEQYKRFNPAEFPGLPSTVTFGIDANGAIQKQIVEGMKLQSSSSLPIFIIADTFNRVVFVSQGYTIGLGEQLLKVIHGL